ncbi:uncharacterized protein LOC121514157 [Cheilinus undulatus]|uniref:uncharacterized protein LOC121514157 n=1 Tax=Cheilinus undulatus TaxID=241271 RepID=UPI001BD5D9B7|nr:uncharacterized protein LOC121514157 [Cheilinus undulatus]
MLRPAAVSAAAAAAVWLLAVLGPVLSLPAEDNSEADFSLCSHCFYRQTPPQGASAGPLLRPLCHRLPGGQTFATLSKPTCDTAVYSAFYLSHGGAESEGEEGGEPAEVDENTQARVPSLLRGDGDTPDPASPPLQHWDSAVTTLVQSSLAPHCSSLEGELYVLIGAGGLRAAEDGDEECQSQPLWCAVCCEVPEGKSGFSVGLIRETGEGERQVSMKELGEILGVSELFSESCGGANEETVGIIAGLHGEELPGSIEEVDADASDENSEAEATESNTSGQTTEEDVESNTAGQTTEEAEESNTEASEVSVESNTVSEATEEEEVTSETASQDLSQATEESREEQTAEEQVPAAAAADVQPEETDAADVTQETSADTETWAGRSDEQKDLRQSRSDRSESSESSAEYEMVDEEQTDTNSSSIFVYILSTVMYIIKAPLRPVFSTITQLPGQVAYVLQEDLGVLSALPGDTYSFFHLLTSDLLSWINSAADMLLHIGNTCFCNTYYCTSSMLGALFNSCHTGVTGVGTLAGDTVGIFGGALDNVWWVTKFFGGRLWEQSEGYVGTVVSEMGGQAKAMGGGVGRLAWRSGSGVGNAFRMGVSFITGSLDIIFGAIRGAFGEESE